MRAKHVMTYPVITATPNRTIREIAQILTSHHISAVPIVDETGKLIGLVSEGDLIRRFEIGTQMRRSWWLSIFTTNARLAEEYARAHAGKVQDVMTQDVISVEPETPLSEIARIFERNRIKRVPVIDEGKLVGIVTRANLVQAIATAPLEQQWPLQDDELRDKVLKHLENQIWLNPTQLNVTIENSTVNLWGMVSTESERHAARIAAEEVAGGKTVNNNVALAPAPAWL
jgi:CBS-domain-containing membrane protein